jgi:[FeFe] hydrogenase H-cluster maturation GTPase HydF
MKMRNTPKSLRLHIAIFGRRNVGKSSLLNAITAQSVSIVSDVAGTTTDPVEKPMELLPIGPVLFIDTAGIDDVGALGQKRIDKTKQIFDRADIAILVVSQGQWTEFEHGVLNTLATNKTPAVVVFNKSDIQAPSEELLEKLNQLKIPFVYTVATQIQGMSDLKQALIKITPPDFLEVSSVVADLVAPGQLAVLVVPIDKEAPKGRLIQPQVQTIRDLLDNDSYCIVVKERELRDALNRLKEPPAIVITDSQAFLKVSGDTPDSVPMTSFSILFARLNGDLNEFVNGALAIDNLKSGDTILIAESCTHHPIADDIGRVKIPRWIRQYTGANLEFVTTQGHDFPENLSDYKLVIQCGGCMSNRREMLSRILKCKSHNVPITNYGVAIAFSLGIFERALKPFQK